MRHKRRRDQPEGGFTLVEMLVAMAICTIVLALSFSVITKIISTTNSGQARSNAIDEARQGVELLQRQIRSGNVLYAPTYNSASKVWMLQVYTQVNGPPRCAQWKLDSLADLLSFRSWSPSWQQDGDVSAWRPIARYVVNTPAVSGDPSISGDAPFLQSPLVRTTNNTVITTLNPNPYGARLLTIHLLIQVPGKQPGSTAVDTSITGRNTTFGYDQALCTSAIPGG